MKLVSYNIQYGTGKDGGVDLERIAGEIGPADIIALQEVERFSAATGHVDQAAVLGEQFAEYYWVYGPALDLDASRRDDKGRVLNRRRQFGNMILARWPIVSSRNHQLPKLNLEDGLSLHRAALEGVIETGHGALRVYSVHLAHASAAERLVQIEALNEIISSAPDGGGAITGPAVSPHWTADGTPPPMPGAAVVLGDFNLTPESEEYAKLTERLHDAWIVAGNNPLGGSTCPDDGRIDYALLSDYMCDRLAEIAVDGEAVGSDHQPLRLDLKE